MSAHKASELWVVKEYALPLYDDDLVYTSRAEAESAAASSTNKRLVVRRLDEHTDEACDTAACNAQGED